MKNIPQMIVVGGPNGAGKTTFVKRAILERGFPYIGADKIAAEISPANPESAAIPAARAFLEQVNSSIENQMSFIVETTLSGKSFANMIRQAKGVGYYIAMQMVFVDSSSTSENRVKNRVRLGGHHVPSSDVQRRFPRSLANFWRLYRELADEWVLSYNGGTQMVTVARLAGGKFSIIDAGLFQLFFELAEIKNDL